MGFSRQEYWSGLPWPSPGDLPNPGIELRSPALQADSLPSEPPGKPKNTGVGSLSLLQWAFPTQELNQCLLDCRWIFYQLRYQGSPDSSVGKESSCNAGDPCLIAGSGRSSGEGIGYPLQCSWASLVAQLVKNPLTMKETWVRSLDWEDPLEKGKATHSSILAWRIPWPV